ncbi:ABC transporter permease [Schleiferilactobacillus harbinensis]|jgi:ABC-2 type transport system permease protein|uniref:ABC transporter permease n=1 Tax=Schleiferilactobacillus harbinensis TaxID=304207 RepID=UPI0007BAD6FD|nr:ABC transporter permease [Schleiferilactobacillus harbinensis]MCT2908498.1 ABC transporter permease [Schleiferilactobacillus harbinensis]HAY54165.1 ABC transporter [Lactobacillus sp.]
MRIALQSELRRTLLLMRRYPTETAAQIILAVVSFYALALGGRFMAGGTLLGTRMTDLIIGYVLWMLVLNTVGDMGFGIAEEAENGTLEQLFLSPLGPLRLFLMRAVITLGTSLVFIICVLIGILLLTGIRLRLELVQLIPFSLALLVALALGLLVASLAIVFKRVSQALSIIQFGFVFLLMIPFDTGGPLLAFVGHFVPLVPMFSLLRQMLHHPAGFAGGGLLLFWSMVNTLVWLLVGLITFQQATNAARHHGTIGHY